MKRQRNHRASAALWMSVIAATLMVSGASAQTNAPALTGSLKEAYKDYFTVGVAINTRQQLDQDRRSEAIIKSQYAAIAPENCMKWESIQPRSGTNGYSFQAADAYVAFGEKNKMLITGHTLVWHAQTPQWVFQDANGRPLQGTNAADRALLLERLHEHIQTVVGRYKGRIKVWDVVNETLSDSGGNDVVLRAQSPWVRILGMEFIEKAFTWAHEADPDVILRYNDYSLENAPKRAKLIKMVKQLQEKKIPIHAIGSQTHVNLTWPTLEQEDQALKEMASLGLPVHITELDVKAGASGQRVRSGAVDANANLGGGNATLDASVQEALAKQYVNLFTAFCNNREHVKLVVFWNVTDADSWLRGQNPLLFDAQGQPKPAYEAVLKLPATLKK